MAVPINLEEQYKEQSKEEFESKWIEYFDKLYQLNDELWYEFFAKIWKFLVGSEGKFTEDDFKLKEDDFKLKEDNFKLKEMHYDLFLKSLENGDLESVRLLIEKGADVNKRFHINFGIETAPYFIPIDPLYLATKNGHTETVRLLIDNGANLEGTDSANEYGLSPLKRALIEGHNEIAYLLVEAGAMIDKEEWNTPLFVAVQCGRYGILNLMEQKLGYNAGDGIEEEPWFKSQCVKPGLPYRPKIDDIVFDKISDTETDYLSPAFFVALKSGSVDEVSSLIEWGEDVNKDFADGMTPLFVAAKNGHTEIVRLLIDKGANLEGECDYGTPLLQATEAGHTEIAKLLIEAGAMIKHDAIVDPLFMAVQCGRSDIISLMEQKLGYEAPKDLSQMHVDYCNNKYPALAGEDNIDHADEL